KDTWIEINFYSDPSCSQDSYLTTLETGLIAPTDVNSNNARLAAFSEDLTQDLATEYNRIYGHLSKEGKETIYSTITVYDTAETCTKEDLDQPVGINGNIKGNASQTFYLSKLLAESITKSKQAGGYGLAPIDIYNVLNNSYELKNEARSADAIKIRAELEKETLKKTKAIFELNPENSPYFTVSGLKTIVAQDFKKGDGYTIVNGTQTLEISVFMGSDSIALKDDDNFYVYLLKCNDDGTIPKGYDTEEHRIKLYSKAREEGNGAAKKIYYEIGGKTDHKTTSGAYVFTIPMSQKIWADPDKEGTLGYADVNLEFGQKYRIFVSGSDTENNPVETTDPSGYGFLFTAGGTAPIVDITEPKDTTVWLKKGDTLPVKGTVKSEEGTPRFMVLNNGEVIKEFTLTPSGTGGLYAFDDEIPASAFDQTESLVYSLEFLATRDETKSPYPKSVWYDVIGPEITMGAPSPLIKADSREGVSKDSVNGQIRFSGSITDQFDRFQSASYKVEQGGAVVSGPSLSGDLESNFNFTLDTSLLADKTDATIIITAYDRAGNQTQASYTYYVDQETDKPMITSTEAGKDITKGTDAAGLAFVKSGNNLFVRGGNLVLSVNDDDGVASARVTVQAYNEASNTYEAIEDLDEKQNLVYNSPSAISHTLPSSVGIYRVTVKVFDNNCNVTNPEETINNYKDIQFFLRVTGTGPDVSITPDRDYIRTGGKYELTINVTDEGNKPYKLKKMVAGSTEEETLLENITDDEITYELRPDSTANIKFTIIDKNSSFTEKNFTPRFDDGAPSIEIKNYPDTPLLTEEESYLFKGEMHDVGNSGIDKVQIKFANGEQTSTDDTGWTDCSAGLANWNSEITWSANPVFNTEGSKTVFVKAIDGAGNEAIDYKTFTYDKSKPVLTIPAYLSTSATNVIFQEVDAANGYTLSGTVTETNGLAENEAIQIKVDDVLVKTMTAAAVTGTNWSYTIPIGSAAGNLKANQAVKIQVIAKDKAGKTDTKQFSVYYDTKSPTLEVSAPASDEPVADPQKAIKGTVSDEEGYGIEKVEFELRKRGTTTVVTSLEGGVNKPVKSEYYRIIVKGEQWFYAGPDGNSVNPVAIPLGADEGALDLYVKATENKNAAGTSGGRITEKTIPFYYDKANPGLEENEVGTTGKTTNGGQGLEITLKGKVWDSNELESLTIKCGNKTWVSGIDSNITITGSTKLESAPAADNWTATFKVGSGNSSVTNYIADGTNEFTIIAKDIAGKEKTLSRSVLVDTTRPTIGEPDIKASVGATIGGVSWYKTRSLPIEVTAADTANGSGVSKVEYSTSSNGGTSWSSWNPLSSDGTKWTGTVSFAEDGKNLKFKVRSTDVATNVSATSPEKSVNIDTTAPNLSVSQNANRYVQRGSSITVTGAYKDEQSGVDELTFKIGDTEINPTVTYSTATLTDKAYNTSGLDKSQIITWKAVFTPEKSGKFSVQGANLAGESTSEVKAFDITIDSEPPVNTNVKLEEVKGSGENTKTKNAYQDTTDSKYYVNNTDKSFKISGVSSDDTGIESVTLKVTNTADSNNELTPTNTGTVGKWEFAIAQNDIKTWTGDATAVVTVKDKSEREVSETFIIVFDTAAPTTVVDIDSKEKNLIFRIGEADNDDITEATASAFGLEWDKYKPAGSSEYVTGIDTKVGKKYANDTYGNDLTIQIRGNFDDGNGSGLSMIYYRVSKTEEDPNLSADALENLKNSIIAHPTGKFAPLANKEVKRVFYNVEGTRDQKNAIKTAQEAESVGGHFFADPKWKITDPDADGYATEKGYYKFYKYIETNFNATISGFTEGINYLILVAEDNAGNSQIETVTINQNGVDNTYCNYSLNVDITAPAIPTKQEEPVFTNLKETNGVVISGTVSDKPNVANGSSGLSKIIITRDGGTGSVEVTNFTAPSAAERTAAGTAYTSDTTLKHWEADVSSLLPSSGMAIISAKVVDNAGYSTSLPVANITVDRKGPAVTINSPAADSAKGSTLTISGTANDGNGAGLSTKATDKIILYATTKASTAGIVTYDPTDNTIITGITIGSASDASTKWVKLAEVATSDEWKFEDLDVSSITSNETNTPVYFTVAVKDASGTGNTGYAAPRRIVIDRKKPTFVSGTVGGKTDTNAWFNTRTLNIAGSFTDPATVTGQNAVNGSGVNYVYYLIGNNEDDKVALPTTDSTYNTNITITGDSSTASLSIWASDAAGNESKRQTYTLQIDADVPEVVENVTAQQPAGYFNNSTLTDGRSQKTFTFLVQDKAGGSTVKTSDASALEVKVGRYSLTTTGTEASSLSISKQENSDGKENYLVTLEIGKTDLARLNGNSSILVTASDVAGNKSPATSIGSLNVDKTAPTVTIKDPDDKGTADKIQINGTFTLEGNARDNNALQVDTGSDKSLKLYYTTKDQTTGITTYANSSPVPTSITTGTDAATAWKSLDSAANAADWSFSINTSTISTGKKTVHFLVETKDEAGNTGYSNPKTLEIDQDTDRPVITFSNLELGPTMSSSTANNYEGYVWLKNTTKIIGTVSDDDGVQSMKISLDGSDWKDVTLTGSAFSYDLKNFYTTESTDVKKEAAANGPKVLYFKVTDKASSPDTCEFTSKTTSSISAVKISDGTNEYGNSTKPDSLLYVKVDTLYPQVILKGAKLASDQSFTNAYNTIRLGGDKKSFVVKLAASDAMGINEVSGTADFVYTVKNGNQEIQSTLSKPGTISDPVTEEGETVYTATFTLSDTDVTTLSGNAGAVNIRVVAKDNAGNETPQTASIAYDFAPSLVTSWNPSSSVTNSGNVTAYGILTENAKVWYSISPSRTVGPNGSVTSWTDGEGTATTMTATVQDWQELPGNSNTWTVNFDNGSSDASHEKSLNMYLIDYGIAPRKSGALATSDDIESTFNKFVKLYLWIKTEDDAGNIKADSVHELLVDPQGDKPSIAFSYPSENSKTLGNEVSIYGTAQDLKGTNIGVDSVWVQIKSTTHGDDTTTNYGTAPSYNESTEVLTMTLTSADLDYMAGNGYKVYKMSDYKVGVDDYIPEHSYAENESYNKRWDQLSTTEKDSETAVDWAALASSSGASWNISINKDAHKELNPPDGTTSNAVGIRVFARDGDKKLSLKADRYVIFDADNPIIKDLYLVQSTDGKLATASTASRQYTPDMFVKGKWYLTGTVTDNMGISELVINGETLIKTESGTASIANGTTIKGTEANPKNWTDCVSIASSGNGETVTFKYPLATDTADSFDNLSFRIVAKDKVTSGNPHEKEEPISINYDNKPPEIARTAEAGKNISADVQQRNSWYNFSSKVTEASQDNKTQSGFAYTAFYFTRNDTVNSKEYLYDVLKARDAAAVNLTGKTIATAFGSEAATENTIVKANDIYWYRKNITRQASLNTFTVSDATGIRKNALVYIDGAMYLITSVTETSVTETSVTIDGYPKNNSDNDVAYVAIAGIVDNTIPEGDGETIQSDGYYNPPSRDDGDRMIESVDNIGTTWT
ncbi:MAG: hypothetical protein IKN54_02160, partial [Lachnospiraceae bacterium]|nr:hypothetical protein [Lachnospiraceae bacterium]